MKKPKKHWASMQFISGGIAPKKSREHILQSRMINLEKRIKELEERVKRIEIQPWNGL